MTKRIEIGNGYVIDICKYNHTVKRDLKVTVDSEGKEVETCNILGYFANVSDAMCKIQKDLVLHKLKPNNTLDELRNCIEETRKEIQTILKPLAQ
jgi:hypothetical protein